ncbi:MAG: ATP-binding protein [Alphaproteobacteria bacterium]
MKSPFLIRSGATWIAVLVTAVVWTAIIALLASIERQAVQGTRHDLANLARLFDEHVSRLVRSTDVAMVAMRRTLEGDAAGFRLEAWLAQNAGLIEDLPQIGVIDARGILVATSVGPLPARIDLSDREHFRVHAEAGGADRLFVSKPVLGRASGKYTIQLTRPYRDKDGRFAGVIVFSLDAFRISRFYDQIDVGRGGSVALVGLDGVVRARAAMQPQTLGQSVLRSRLFEELKRAPSGTYVSASAVDGVERLFAYRQLADYPLVVLVGAAGADYLAGYQHERAVLLALGALLTIAVAIAALLAARHERNSRAAEVRAQRAEADQWFHAVTLSANDAILSWGEDGAIAIWNRGAEATFGLDAQAARAAGLAVLFEADSHALLREEAARLAAGGSVRAGQVLRLVGRRLDGTPVQIEASLNVRTTDGRRHCVLVARDIGERLRNQAEREALAARVFHAEKMEAIGTLAGGVAHDFNNFVGAMQGFIWLARRGVEAEHPAAGHLDKAASAGQRAAAVVQQLLDYSRSVPGRAQRLDFAAVVREAFDLACVSMPSSVRRTLELPDAALPTEGDTARLQQAILNLVINAAQAIGDRQGRIELRADLAVLAEDRPAGADFAAASPWRQLGDLPAGRYARLAVRDSGGGMAPAVMERMFEPFFTTKPPELGTGLGLAGVEAAILAHGGGVRVESLPGVGAVFEIFLPLAGSETVAARPAETPPPAGRNARILVAEDEADMRDVIGAVLGGLGYRIDIARNGREALDMIERDGPVWQAVITDLVMPEAGGERVAREIKRRFPHIVVILCTGRADKAGGGHRDLFDAVVAKTEAAEALPRVLEEVLVVRRAA